MTTHASICRFCHAGCAILVDVEDGRAVRVTGGHANPVYSGYSCAKGRQLPRQHAHEDRLLHSVKRGPEGGYRPIASAQAVDEIAARVRAIVDEHGPRSIALYIGTYSGPYLASAPAAVGWLLALGSRMVFTASTIDQPGKSIANALHGRWLAGGYMFDEGDSWLLVGTNPIVSMSGGISAANPGRRMHEARARGQKLVVIDPRRTEVARFADVFLQPRPGEDPTLLAAMLHVIVKEELYDRVFVEAHATGFEALCRVVERFDPVYAAERAGVSAADIERASRLFAGGRRGGAVAGTGPNFSGRGNLTEYLLLCLNTLSGYWRREGERVPNPGALLPAAVPVAQAEPAKRAWGFGEKLRVRGFASTAAGLPTAALAEEILLEGEGRIRALFCIGSNPVAAWPDQLLAIEAIRKLDLCVTLDVKMSATSRRADYVIAPKLSFEVPGVSLQMEALEQTYVSMGYPSAYAQYAPALVDPPEGSDVIEEWEFFYGLAQRMGSTMRLYPLRPEAGVLRESRDPVDLDMSNKPTSDELLAMLTEGSRISLDEIKKHPHGAVFDDEPVPTAAQEPGWEGRLELADPTMLAELAQVRAESFDRAAEEAVHPFRLISRRLPNVYNSSGRDLPSFTRKRTYNPAFMNPDDLESLGLSAGEVVRIQSDRAAILGVVEAAPELRRGVVSMSHAFGDAPDRDGDFRKIGSSTSRLVDTARDYDPYSGIPRMSAIPVRVERFVEEVER